MRDALLMGWGWYLNEQVPNETIHLELQFADSTSQTITCHINRAREDVAIAYPSCIHAVSVGFIFLARLRSRSVINQATLSVLFTDGRTSRHPINGFPEQFSPDAISMQMTFTRIQKAWQLARAGRIAYVLKRLREMLRSWFSRVSRQASQGLSNTGQFELIFDHELGGGANKYRHEQIAALRAANTDMALVTFDLPRLTYRLVLHRGSDKAIETHDDLSSLESRLSTLTFTRIHLNNLVSYPDPLAILQLIQRLRRAMPTPLAIYLHDFLPVCPSFTLINANGRYCGVPDAGTCRTCLSANKTVFPSLVTLTEIAPWREAWAAMLHAATEIIAFSESTAEIYGKAFPAGDWWQKLIVRPHEIRMNNTPHSKLIPQFQTPLKIAVVGHINFAKGAEIINDLLLLIAARQLALHIVVIGTLERRITSPALTITGPFENAALSGLLKKHSIGVCLLPSICPETFSYVTEEIITLGMPIVCFNLGAPASRVARYQRGAVASETSAEGALAAVKSLTERLSARASTSNQS